MSKACSRHFRLPHRTTASASYPTNAPLPLQRLPSPQHGKCLHAESDARPELGAVHRVYGETAARAAVGPRAARYRSMALAIASLCGRARQSEASKPASLALDKYPSSTSTEGTSGALRTRKPAERCGFLLSLSDASEIAHQALGELAGKGPRLALGQVHQDAGHLLRIVTGIHAGDRVRAVFLVGEPRCLRICGEFRARVDGRAAYFGAHRQNIGVNRHKQRRLGFAREPDTIRQTEMKQSSVLVMRTRYLPALSSFSFKR